MSALIVGNFYPLSPPPLIKTPVPATTHPPPGEVQVFSGIVEAVSPILSASQAPGVVRIQLQKPSEFNDLKIGDSISTNGVCLTLESQSQQEISFALAAETLKVLGLKSTEVPALVGQKLNLERSLRFGDRIHGHLVTGHVDSMGHVVERLLEGESLFLKVEIKDSVRPFIWKKGSITLNGCSLTVNEVAGNTISVCLIPETQKRTNLGELKLGDLVTVEPDYMARAVVAASVKGAHP